MDKLVARPEPARPHPRCANISSRSALLLPTIELLDLTFRLARDSARWLRSSLQPWPPSLDWCGPHEPPLPRSATASLSVARGARRRSERRLPADTPSLRVRSAGCNRDLAERDARLYSAR